LSNLFSLHKIKLSQIQSPRLALVVVQRVLRVLPILRFLPFRSFQPFWRVLSVAAFTLLPLGQSSPVLAQPDLESKAVEHTLANGLKLIVKEDNRAPTVVHMVWYRAGSIDEVNGKTGVAHALEHLMFKGTKTIPQGEFSKRVAQFGGRENAFTNRDYTGYFQQVPKKNLAEVMRFEADRMSNLVLTREEFEKEIKVVMEERRLRTDDQANALVYEALLANAFIASPQRAPVIGWMNDLQAMTVDDALAWYGDWYAPNNAIVVVVGDVKVNEVLQVAEQTYGQAKTRTLPPRKPQIEPPQKGIKRVAVKAPAENPYVILGFHVPKLQSIDSADREPYALEVLAGVLDADENGRLTRELVRASTRLADSAGASYEMTLRGPALFLLDATPAQGKTSAELEQALRTQIRKIADNGVRESELRRVKTQYVASQVYKRDSIMGQAMELASLEIVGFSHRDADRILEKIRSVTAAEVQAVAAKYFGDDALTVVNLLPQPLNAQPRSPAIPNLRH
jgi:zinc protease